MNEQLQTPVKSIQLVCTLGLLSFESSPYFEGSAYQQLLSFEAANQPVIGHFSYNVILADSGKIGETNSVLFSGDTCKSSLQSFMAQYENQYEILPGDSRFMVSDCSAVIQYDFNLNVIGRSNQQEFDHVKSILGYSKILVANGHSHALMKFIIQDSRFEKSILAIMNRTNH